MCGNEFAVFIIGNFLNLSGHSPCSFSVFFVCYCPQVGSSLSLFSPVLRAGPEPLGAGSSCLELEPTFPLVGVGAEWILKARSRPKKDRLRNTAFCSGRCRIRAQSSKQQNRTTRSRFLAEAVAGLS